MRCIWPSTASSCAWRGSRVSNRATWQSLASLAVIAFPFGAMLLTIGYNAGRRDAPEYVARQQALDDAAGAEDAALKAMRLAPPADRYEMCDRFMEMAGPLLIEEQMRDQAEADAAAHDAARGTSERY